MNGRPVRSLGWAVLAAGALLTVAGIAMYVLPGPGLPVLLLGLVITGAGGLLVAAGSRRVGR